MDSEASLGLTHGQRQFVNESVIRNKTAEKILIDELTYKERVMLFWNDTKERVSIGKYVNRIKVEGNVGEELKVKIAGISLNRYLPSGVIFKGVSVGESFQKDNVVPFDGPFYDPYRREICVPIKKEQGIVTRTINEVKNSGLIIVHELGHAIDDKERPDRLDNCEKARTMEILYRRCASEGTWFSKQHFDALKTGQSFDNNLIQLEIKEIVKNRLDNLLLSENEHDLKDRLRIRNTDQNAFVSEIVSEVAFSIYRIYELAKTKATEEDSKSALNFVKIAFDNNIRSSFNKYHEELAKETARSERQAWAHGLEIARKLVHEHGIKFWDKSFKELAFFIDILINAHGVDAGRKGVKNLKSRKALYMPN